MRCRGAALTGMVLVAILGGCEGAFDDGSKPVGLRVVTEAGGEGPIEQTECAAGSLRALGLWDGSEPYESDVSARATWTSDDPGVLVVGDGVSATAGAFEARGAGTTQVRVRFLDYSAAMTVTVLPIVETRIVPDTSHLAPGSIETFQLQVRTDVDGGWQGQSAQWSILQATAGATMGGGGAVQALDGTGDETFEIEASMSTCAITARRELRVSPVSHLELAYEQPSAVPLPLGITTMIRVLAHFQDPAIEPQDISDQVEVELEDTEEGAATFTQSAEGVVLRGQVDGGEAQLGIRYAPLDLSVLADRYAFAELEQETLRIDPAELTVQYPDEVQLNALGRFSDGIERIVTRHVTWSVSDATVAEVTNGANGRGLLTVEQDVNQTIQVEVFGTIDDKAVTAETEVNIVRADEP